MRARLLAKRPLSGEYEEHWFDTGGGDCVSVLFEDSSYRQWLGVFGALSITKYTECLLFPTTSSALVVAKGKGYVVEINSNRLRYRPRCDFIVAALPVPDRDLIVAADFTRVHALSSSHEVWSSNRLALDGIQLTTATGKQLSGMAWHHDGWFPFSVDLDNFSVSSSYET